MTFKAKVVLDSIGPNKKRLTTLELKYPRFIHSEYMTHRDRERNAASSRAIPWKAKRKPFPMETEVEYMANMSIPSVDTLSTNCMYHMIATGPVVPLSFGREKRGMQQGDVLEGVELAEAQRIWLEARDNALRSADMLASMGVHKSIVNRLTEPFMWITIVTTATEWNNFFRLRCHPAAEQHMRKIAEMAREVIMNSIPTELKAGEWHCPYITIDDVKEVGVNWELLKKLSIARCARVSYLTHDGRRDQKDDLKLYETLMYPVGDVDERVMHASPFGHVAEASDNPNLRSGPFVGWFQARKEHSNENVPGMPGSE